MTQHRLGHFEVCDHAVFQRSHGHDVGRRPAEHPFRFIADREHFVGAGLDGDNRRFAQDNPLVFNVDQRVRRPEIDPDVVG